jgi:hypothetical protein
VKDGQEVERSWRSKTFSKMKDNSSGSGGVSHVNTLLFNIWLEAKMARSHVSPASSSSSWGTRLGQDARLATSGYLAIATGLADNFPSTDSSSVMKDNILEVVPSNV